MEIHSILAETYEFWVNVIHPHAIVCIDFFLFILSTHNFVSFFASNVVDIFFFSGWQWATQSTKIYVVFVWFRTRMRVEKKRNVWRPLLMFSCWLVFVVRVRFDDWMTSIKNASTRSPNCTRFLFRCRWKQFQFASFQVWRLSMRDRKINKLVKLQQ